MRFDTVHEYNFHDGRTHLHYCEQHETLMVVTHRYDSTDRLMIEGLSKSDIDEFRLELNKLNLEEAVS